MRIDPNPHRAQLVRAIDSVDRHSSGEPLVGFSLAVIKGFAPHFCSLSGHPARRKAKAPPSRASLDTASRSSNLRAMPSSAGESYDAIVVGVGGWGSAALYQLARRGWK